MSAANVNDTRCWSAREQRALALRVREHAERLAARGGGFIGASLSCADLLVHIDTRVLALTPERLTQWLSDPHPPMPNLSLANEEIAALVAYIGSLRTE